jgi:N-acetylated-alpha-linked acidic dipeptidase
MIGSVEWIEEYVNWLTETAVAYLNIDVAVSGPVPDFSATPELNTIANELMKKIIHPNDGAFNQTLYDKWYDVNEGELGILGSGSDYTGFVHRGISSVSLAKLSKLEGMLTVYC